MSKKVNSPKPGNHLVVCLPDIHFPYQDPQALECAMRVIEELKPQKVLLLGDILDAGAFSSHPKRTLLERNTDDFYDTEVKPAKEMLDRIEESSKERIVLLGNHEARLEAVAAQYAHMSSIYSLVSPEGLLTQGRRNITVVPYTGELAHYKIAKDLWAIHGVYWGTHAAYAHLQAFKPTSLIFGHVHRQQSHVTRIPATGQIVKAWSPGCLSKLQPVWGMGNPTTWVHGLSLIYVKNDLSSWVEYTLTINNGETILPSGRTVKA